MEVRADFSEEVSWKWKLDGKESAMRRMDFEISPSGQIQRLFFKKKKEKKRNGNSIRREQRNICVFVALSVFSYSHFMMCFTHKVRVNFLFVCKPPPFVLVQECGCWQLWCGRYVALDFELSFRLCKDFPLKLLLTIQRRKSGN